jgi:hypothetical protein
VNLYDFSNKIFPAQAFIRIANAELTTASRLDVYIPNSFAMHFFLIYRMMFVLAGACFGMAAYIKKGSPL